MIQAIVFDMDGLLVDSEPHWFEARRGLAASVGQEWTEDDQRAMMGVSTADWVEYTTRRLGLDLSPSQVQDEIVGRMTALYRERIPFMPGSVQAVNLAAQHFPTALASGSHRALIDAVMNDPNMRGKFTLIVCGDQVRAGKPAPDIYLETARRLGIQPEHCACVEDSGNGILAGRAAWMKVIAVPSRMLRPPPDILAQADCVLESLEEFSLDLIQSL